MSETDLPEDRDKAGDGLLSRLQTGTKVFLIISAALLPLALIGLFAALQTTRSSDVENRARLRVAAVEASRTLAIELAGDANALRLALRALERDPSDAPSCARLRGVFAQGGSRGATFAVHDAAGTLRCGTPFADTPRLEGREIEADIDGTRGVTLIVKGSRGDARATAFFPTALLAELGRPENLDLDYGIILVDGLTRLTLDPLPGVRLAPRDRLAVPLGIDDLLLEMTIPSAPITSPVLIAMVLPLLMWAAAAGIAWFVVDRLLIRPLRTLRRDIGAYLPGTVFASPGAERTPTQEIRDLAATFSGLSRTLLAHESELAEGLVRQTKLTREVHHRVKNNLQVIASLINFHARSAKNADVSTAYASIQRRVDALAVVHRNHFAEMEVNRGLSLRAMVSELAANLRATAPDGSGHLTIALEVEPYLVSQDTAVAVAFLVTELVELAMGTQSATHLRISAGGSDAEANRAVLRISSPTLIESDAVRTLLTERYGRVIEGLSRQLRSKLHYDPLTGAFEIAILVLGKD